MHIMKMRRDVFSLLLLLGTQGVLSIHIVELQVPGHAAADNEALLGCQFELDDDLLYSVKWYKDRQEFYRYLPRATTQSMAFNRSGVTVDLSRSSSNVVTLVNLTPESAGVYRCEVSGETPYFTTVAEEKYINIHVHPKAGPRITGLRFQYNVGDRLVANCSLPGSRPEAQLQWLVNRKPVPKGYIRGPWRKVVEDPPNTIATTLGLNLMVLPRHFIGDVLEVKCRATIAPLYQREKAYVLTQPDPSPEPPEDPDSSVPDPVFLDLPPDEADEEIHEDLLDKFKQLANTLRLDKADLAPSQTNLSAGTPFRVPTDVPESDNASLLKMSVTIVLLTLLVQVILV